MGKFFRFLFFAAVIGGIVYFVRKNMSSSQPAMATRSGGLPAQPVRSLDDAPLGGQISPELLRILVCPEDKGPLELVEEGKFLLNPRNGYKYQIYAYLRSRVGPGDAPADSANGLLLHPSIGDMVDETVRIQGHSPVRRGRPSRIALGHSNAITAAVRTAE